MRLTDTVALVGSGDVRLSNRYDCNVYAMDAPDGVVLVDAGAGRSTDRILDRAREAIGTPTAAVLTHAHADHVQGVPDFPDGIEVVASEETATLVERGDETRLGITAAKRDDVYPSDYVFEPFSPDRTFRPDTTIEVAGLKLEIVRVRGHASDHVCFLLDETDRTIAFVGDVLYPDGSISLLNVPGSSLAHYRADMPKLYDRHVDALLPGHGHPRLADGNESIETAHERLRGMFSPTSKT